jgi:hypothetical protein
MRTVYNHLKGSKFVQEYEGKDCINGNLLRTHQVAVPEVVAE